MPKLGGGGGEQGSPMDLVMDDKPLSLHSMGLVNSLCRNKILSYLH